MKLKVPEIPGVTKEEGLDTGFRKVRASNVETHFSKSVIFQSTVIVCIISIVMLILIWIDGSLWSYGDFMNNVLCNIIALVPVVAILDVIVSSHNEGRRKRDEARAILRHNRIIQPDIDTYLVRKNMVITPNGKTVRKFQVDSDFTINDMRDMYGPSELVSDVGISKIRRYDYFQDQLRQDFEKLVEGVDFTHYPEISEAAMKYINATSYGEAALHAVVGYEDSRAGTRSMRVMVTGMIRDEPEDGRFMDANPTMKNVYLVHQMINDQEQAVSKYLDLIRALEEEVGDQKLVSETDYE